VRKPPNSVSKTVGSHGLGNPVQIRIEFHVLQHMTAAIDPFLLIADLTPLALLIVFQDKRAVRCLGFLGSATGE
jgi:hypothetical protein